MEQKKVDIIKRAKSDIAIIGYFKLATCDYRNWDVQEHFAMKALHRNQPEGLLIEYKINHGVYDWVITTN